MSDNFRSNDSENLYNLYLESMTFSVSEAETEPDNLLELSFKLSNPFYKFVKDNNIPIPSFSERIVPDGDSVFETSGILNFYLDGVPDEYVEKLVSLLKYYIGEYNGQVVGEPYREKSGMYKGDVYRIPVNMDEDVQNPPEMNLSNVNAMTLMRDVLNYEYSDGYRIRANELMMKLETVEDNDFIINKAAREDSKEGNFYSVGLPPERIKSYIKKLKEICEWAIENGYSYITIS